MFRPEAGAAPANPSGAYLMYPNARSGSRVSGSQYCLPTGGACRDRHLQFSARGAVVGRHPALRGQVCAFVRQRGSEEHRLVVLPVKGTFRRSIREAQDEWNIAHLEIEEQNERPLIPRLEHMLVEIGAVPPDEARRRAVEVR
jgi:hypothetical protein